MKIALRVFNVIIMFLSALATFLLFATTTLSFNSNIALDVEKISGFIPETMYSDQFNIPELLGTDTIQVRLFFNLNPVGTLQCITGNRDVMNENLIVNNVDEITDILDEPISLITDFSIRSILKSTVHDQIYQSIDEARTQYGSDSTTEEIMDEVGMDDQYFTDFSINLYDALNADGATVDSATEVLYHQIDDALAKAEDSGVVDTSGFSSEKIESIKDSLMGILTDLELVNSDGTLKKIGQIAYIYVAESIKVELDGEVDAETLAQQTGENNQDYADRLITLLITHKLPDMFYQVVQISCSASFIGLFVFALLWVLLFVITIIKTFSSRPWTIFGPWFWIIGPLQLVLGIGLTVVGKYVVPKLPLEMLNLPVKTIILAPRTYALSTSIVFIVIIVVAFIYGFIKRSAKREARRVAARYEQM